MTIISDKDAIRFILMGSSRVAEERHPRYAFYLGAGASVEAGVSSAEAICREIEAQFIAGIDPGDEAYCNARIDEIKKKLDSNDPSMRYVSSITAAYPQQSMRVEYFRGMLRGIAPSFCHHAVALLIRRGYLKSTCLTTNFDKLLESAFVQQGESECQPVRTDEELSFWMKEEGRHYVLKLHGDYDTHNISNTSDETVMISDAFRNAVALALDSAGLVVIGTAGYEKSIHTLFDFLSKRAVTNSNVLRFGLLWGVYMGSSRPEGLTPAALEASVRDRVEKTVGPDIRRMMERTANARFFPVWGAANFLYDLIQATENRLLIGTANRYLDREMRLRQAFRTAKLSDEAITEHLGTLHRNRNPPVRRQAPEVVSTVVNRSGKVQVRIVYGDITSRTFMGSKKFEGMNRAVVSPDDTFITAGGGVAEDLLGKAGSQFMLNELAKFAPIGHGEVAVTSAGDLPVEYVFHAAAIKVGQTITRKGKETKVTVSYEVSKESVSASVSAALAHAEALGVDALWIPLMGTGSAGLDARKSLDGILEAIRRWEPSSTRPMIIMIFIYKFTTLETHVVDEAIRRSLGRRFVKRIKPDPAPPRSRRSRA